jgi:ApeA N-terminal domain 1
MADDRDEPLPLDAPAELAGEWWVPGRREHIAHGRLTYSPEVGVELHLTSGKDVLPATEPTPWLHGQTVRGRPVTLRNCSAPRAWTASWPGGVEARARVELAFIGMHAASSDELSMLSLAARIFNFREWLGMSGFEVSRLGRTEIGYSHPRPVKLTSNDAMPLSAVFELTGESTPSGVPFSINLEQRAWLEVSPRRKRRFDDLRSSIDRFSRLLSFASGMDCPILELEGTARVRVTDIAGGVTSETSPVWVLYARPGQPPTQLQVPERMLFRHEDALAHNLRPILRWFRRAEMHEPISNLYLSALPSKALNIEYRFLAFVQALEGFHRRKAPGHIELKSRLEALVAALPASIRTHVHDDFTKLAKDTRHYFSHWEPKLEAKAAKGEQLVALTIAVKLLYELAMLRELGFGQTEITQLVLSNRRLSSDLRRGFLALTAM